MNPVLLCGAGLNVERIPGGTIGDGFVERAIMDFNGNLLTRCGKTYLRAFL